MEIGIIYMARNIYNDKVYIGRTCLSLEDRIKFHYDTINNVDFNLEDYNENSFQMALCEFESESFEWRILEVCYSSNQLKEREKYWIKEYNSTDNYFGYNILKGGGGFNSKAVYYDGSSCDDNFLNNNSYFDDFKLLGKVIDSITCKCKKISYYYVDSFSLPTRDSLICDSCKTILFSNITEYRDRYFNKANKIYKL